MNQSHLPVELYRPILKHVRERRDLLSLLGTSRALRSEAEVHFYHTISIQSPSRSTSARLLVERLTESEWISQLVISLTLKDIAPNEREMVENAVSQMVNLKILEVNGEPTSRIPFDLPDQHPPFQLHTLITYLPNYQPLRNFIQAQPQIKKFIWDPGSWGAAGNAPNLEVFDSSALPSLETLLTSGTIIPMLLDGRSIVHLSTPPSASGLVMPKIGSVYPTVRSFVTHEDLIEDFLPDMFPNIRFLQIWHTPIEDVEPGVRRLMHLEKLRTIKHVPDPDFQAAEYAAALFSFQPTLKFVEFCLEGYGLLEGTGFLEGIELARFTRDDEGSSVVTISGSDINMEEWMEW